MKKALSMLLAVIMCVSLFAACGGDSSSSSSSGDAATTTAAGDAATTTAAAEAETTTEAPKDVDISGATLKVVTMYGGDDPHTSLYKESNDKFTADKGVKISDSSAKADGTWQTKVVADFNAGNVPDVLFFFNAAQGQQLVDTGNLIDIETIRGVNPDYAKNITDSILTSQANTAKDGKSYCVPIKGFSEGLFVNKQMFTDAGLEYPKSWDDLLKCVETFKGKDIIPISGAIGTQPHYWYDHLMLMEAGAEKYQTAITAADAVPAEMGAGLDLIKTLYDNGAFSKDTESLKGDNAADNFKNKKAAMYLDGSWHAGQYEAKPAEGANDKIMYAEDVDYIPFVSKDGSNQHLLAGFSSGWYITKAAWDDEVKRAAAIEYVMYMTSDDMISQFCGPDLGGLPASSTVKLDAAISPLFSTVASITNEYPAVFPTQDNNKESANKIWIQDMIKVAKGEMSGADLLKDVYTEQLKS